MNSTESFRSQLHTTRGRLIIVGIGLIVAALAFIGLTKNGQPEEILKEPTPIVKVTTASEYLGGESVSLVGTVRAFSEAAITSERGGRVTSVRVKLGDSVGAGQIIATLENAAESASVLQAEGVYEAALASAAQSNVGKDEAQNTLASAENTAISTFKSAYNTNNSAIRNTIDTFFSNPSGQIPGLRIEGKGYTSTLNAERVTYQSILPEWQAKTLSITTQSDIDAELRYAKDSTQRTIRMVDTFITVFSEQKGFSSRYSETELQTFVTNFSSLRSNLLATESSIDAALTGLSNARDTVRRAELTSTGSVASASDAQIKQALGSLRAAQANYAKTILRSPISGAVNSLDIRTGDFINSFTQVAIVANNNALEIVTYVGDSERQLLSIGDVVMVDGEYEGRVSQIAPAVDATTRKTEVRIAVENADIQNGDTVTVSKEITEAPTSAVIVPLTAVKFELEDGLMFFVEDGKLTSRRVTLGPVRGASVEISKGLTQDDEFVVDARGLLAGTEVEVNK